MSDSDTDDIDNTRAEWDPELTERFIRAVSPISKRWFRWEVRGLEAFPPAGGAMVVSNHSGGMLTADVLILACAFYERFGYDRPVYTLGHDALFAGPLREWMTRFGLIHADRVAAVRALRSGGIVLEFPGGVYDAYRPTTAANVIDFNCRKGYIRVAHEAGVPLVPAASIGGQESQLFLTRGTWMAKRLGLSRFRSDILPVTVGFPFGLSALLPVNIPLPTKIVTEVLEPVDIIAQFGDDPDVDRVDAHVRSQMQSALDRLSRQRRFPIIG